jgi:pyruvate dehydrogenase E1 component alpha subunit
MDVEAVAAAAGRALDTIRGGGGPVFLELLTYRFRAHSMYDPDRYRDPAEIERWKERDPIVVLGDRLRADGALDDATQATIEAEVAAEVDDAVEFAEASPLDDVETLTRWVYSDDSSVPSSLPGAPR